nr:MAG TPA: hypothetical protein [Caudoviricetes sp.]
MKTKNDTLAKVTSHSERIINNTGTSCSSLIIAGIGLFRKNHRSFYGTKG